MSRARTAPRKAASDDETHRFRRWKVGELIARRWYVHHALPPTHMSMLYFCLDMLATRPMVIKTLHPRLLSDAAGKEHFAKECELWVRIGEHPNIARAFFAELVVDHPYVFIEWVYGKSLYDAGLDSWIGSAQLTLDRVAMIVRQVCDAKLYAAKALGSDDQELVHGDIKPSNILITSKWSAKLTDFGLARARLMSDSEQRVPGEDWRDNKFIGTPKYMSPEQFVQGSVDGRSDVYSLGCTLFELITGRPVFMARGWGALREAHLHRPAPRLRDLRCDVPVYLDDLVASCLAKEPSARPGIREVREQLPPSA